MRVSFVRVCVSEIFSEQGQFKWLSYEIVTIVQRYKRQPCPFVSGMGFSSVCRFIYFCSYVFVLLSQEQVYSVYLPVANVASEQDEH